MGLKWDQNVREHKRQYLGDLVQRARDLIYKEAAKITGAAVNHLLKPTSSVPTVVSYQYYLCYWSFLTSAARTQIECLCWPIRRKFWYPFTSCCWPPARIWAGSVEIPFYTSYSHLICCGLRRTTCNHAWWKVWGFLFSLHAKTNLYPPDIAKYRHLAQPSGASLVTHQRWRNWQHGTLRTFCRCAVHSELIVMFWLRFQYSAVYQFSKDFFLIIIGNS